MSETVNTKICSVCKIEKSTNDFFKRKYKSGLIGTHYQCKSCVNEYKRKYYSDPVRSEKKKEWYRQHYINNKEKIDQHQREYYKNNKSKKNAATKEYYKNNREKCRIFIKAHKIKYKDRLSKLAYLSHKRRYENDPMYKLKWTLRRRVKDFFKSKNQRKSDLTFNLVGADIVTVKKHIERQFKKGMSWQNHGHGVGKWHLDHIIPLASAKNEEDVVKLFHYTNLQPLWSEENIKKGSKIPAIQIKIAI